MSEVLIGKDRQPIFVGAHVYDASEKIESNIIGRVVGYCKGKIVMNLDSCTIGGTRSDECLILAPSKFNKVDDYLRGRFGLEVHLPKVGA